jgi:hypothetical protein
MFKVGQKWKCRNGEVATIVDRSLRTGGIESYPFAAHCEEFSVRPDRTFTITSGGFRISPNVKDNFDLIELLEDVDDFQIKSFVRYIDEEGMIVDRKDDEAVVYFRSGRTATIKTSLLTSLDITEWPVVEYRDVTVEDIGKDVMRVRASDGVPTGTYRLIGFDRHEPVIEVGMEYRRVEKAVIRK